jgi:hypothetical protein
MARTLLRAAGLAALAAPAVFAAASAAATGGELCVDCIQVRVGPPVVVRGPFPDELDAPFSAVRLPDGTFRGFSANAATYAIEGASLKDMRGSRHVVLEAGAPGSPNDCGSWLTSVGRSDDELVGLVHQEHACDYDLGRTHKSMAISTSADDGLTWTAPRTIITGTEAPQPDRTSGEGDCTMVDGHDGFLYAYCLRNSDWQTIVARAPARDPADWRKFYDGAWREPGLGGNATAIGFIGPGAGFLAEHGWVAAITTDPWFGGVRLSLSADKVTFADLKDPLITIDGSDWDRPAATDLVAYGTVLNPNDGSNAVDDRFLLSYIYVPPGAGFESRYLVQHEVALSVGAQPQAVQAGMALTRWVEPVERSYVTSTGPLTDDRLPYTRDATVAYVLTRAPDGAAAVKIEECSSSRSGQLDHMLSEDGTCEAGGYTRERTAGWLFAASQPGTVPVYRCTDGARRVHFASNAADCEGLGAVDVLLGHGLAP